MWATLEKYASDETLSFLNNRMQNYFKQQTEQ